MKKLFFIILFGTLAALAQPDMTVKPQLPQVQVNTVIPAVDVASINQAMAGGTCQPTAPHTFCAHTGTDLNAGGNVVGTQLQAAINDRNASHGTVVLGLDAGVVFYGAPGLFPSNNGSPTCMPDAPGGFGATCHFWIPRITDTQGWLYIVSSHVNNFPNYPNTGVRIIPGVNVQKSDFATLVTDGGYNGTMGVLLFQDGANRITMIGIELTTEGTYTTGWDAAATTGVTTDALLVEAGPGNTGARGIVVTTGANKDYGTALLHIDVEQLPAIDVITGPVYQGVWAATTTYSIGQEVKGSDNEYYTSLINSNVNNDPSLENVLSPVNWKIQRTSALFTSGGPQLMTITARNTHFDTVNQNGSALMLGYNGNGAKPWNYGATDATIVATTCSGGALPTYTTTPPGICVVDPTHAYVNVQWPSPKSAGPVYFAWVDTGNVWNGAGQEYAPYDQIIYLTDQPYATMTPPYIIHDGASHTYNFVGTNSNWVPGVTKLASGDYHYFSAPPALTVVDATHASFTTAAVNWNYVNFWARWHNLALYDSVNNTETEFLYAVRAPNVATCWVDHISVSRVVPGTAPFNLDIHGAGTGCAWTALSTALLGHDVTYTSTTFHNANWITLNNVVVPANTEMGAVQINLDGVWIHGKINGTFYLPDEVTPCPGHGSVCTQKGATYARVGAVLNGSNSALINSDVSELMLNQGTFESHGITYDQSSGPLKVENNHISAVTEIVFSGGGFDSYIATYVEPYDITVKGNWLEKPQQVGSFGIAQTVKDTSYGMITGAKNCYENKSAARILVTGNICENSWEGYMIGYGGIVMTPRTAAGQGNEFLAEQDITFAHNLFRNLHHGHSMTPVDDNCVLMNSAGNDINCGGGTLIPSTGRRFWFYDNGFAILNKWDPGGSASQPYGFFLADTANVYVGANHNTYWLNGGMNAPGAVPFNAWYSNSDGGACGNLPSATYDVWTINNYLWNEPGGVNGYVGNAAICHYLTNPSTPPNDVTARFTGNMLGANRTGFPPNNQINVPNPTIRDLQGFDFSIASPVWTSTTDGLQVATITPKVAINPIFKGRWNSTTAYNAGDVVRDTIDQMNYEASITNTGNQPSTSPNFWQANLPAGVMYTISGNPNVAHYQIRGVVTGLTPSYIYEAVMYINGGGLLPNTTVLTDINGNYVFPDVPPGTYTITPQTGRNTFTPTSQTVTVSSGTLTGVNFSATPSTNMIGGYITTNLTFCPSGSGTNCTWISTKTFAANDEIIGSDNNYYYSIAGSNLNHNPVSTIGYWNITSGSAIGGRLEGAQVSVVGTANQQWESQQWSGGFGFWGLGPGTYTITPLAPGLVFSPSSITVTLPGQSRYPPPAGDSTAWGANDQQITLVPTSSPYTINAEFGPPAYYANTSVQYCPTAPCGGANLTKVTTAPVTGQYSLSGTTYTFAAGDANAQVGINYQYDNIFSTTSVTTYNVTGTVTGGGNCGAIAMVMGGAVRASTFPDGGGNYTFPGLLNNSYTVTPQSGLCTFSPSSRSMTVASANQPGQNFTVIAGSSSVGTKLSPGIKTGPGVIVK